ncbi:hypothetical protein O181_107224, partial [Austropuccinia psidii MF-1]|nr:hypothetical protein [Austropuccinia psidii MF-1]
FEDNPTERNQATVERFVEETCPRSPTPIVIKKNKAKKLDFPGHTIQDSEVMTTRRGSQYSIQSDGVVLRGRIDSSKGKRKGNIPSGTESTQGSPISQRQVPEMPKISEPELEVSMSNSNRYKSHSEGSDRHLHEQLQAVLHSVQGERLENVAPNTPRSDELPAHPQKVPHRGGDSGILQWMESTVIQASNQKRARSTTPKRRRQARNKPK